MIQRSLVEELARKMAEEFGLSPAQTRDFINVAENTYKKAGKDLFDYLLRFKAVA